MNDPHLRGEGLDLFRRFCREEPPGKRRGLCGIWLPDRGLTPAHLLVALEQAERYSSSRVLKQDRRTLVLHSILLGCDVVIKKYTLPTWMDKFKYQFRKSLARRFWAAARTLQVLHVPTPEPLGFMESYIAGVPVCSYVINRHIPNAPTVRQWFETRYAECPKDEQDAFRLLLLRSLLALYAHGLYHRDTKCENMLVEYQDDPAQRQILWIDLECLRPKYPPSRRDIIRNLVQINGSLLERFVPAADRLDFLKHMAYHYPWADQSPAMRRICSWTRRRLDKEKRAAS